MASVNVKPSLKLDTAQQMPPPSNPDNPRPILKLNTSARQSSFSGDLGTPTPSGESRKIKIKLNSQPSTPATASTSTAPTAAKSKAGRTSKPTAKLIESKKRNYDSDEDQPLSGARQDSSRPSKMIKIKHSATTPVSSIKFKLRGEAIERHPGDGYDSEASDREVDPTRESTFILRVTPGPATDYLRKALTDGTVGLPKQNGGADFAVQFLDAKQRRAMVTIDGIHYAAVLVHLPTITEAMKSWDRKNMMKNSDITEMLLCFEAVQNEGEAKTIPLPAMVVKNEYRWPHGLTPPMHDASRQRFRKTLSAKQWQSTAAQVSQLLEDDASALESHVEFMQDEYGYADSDEDEDAEGEIEQDYFADQPEADTQNVEEPEAEDEMLLAMEAELEEDELKNEKPTAVTPATQLEAPTPVTIGGNTPQAVGGTDEPMSEEDESDDDDDDDDELDDAEDGQEVDDEQLAAERERKEKFDAMADLQRSLEETELMLSGVMAPLLKKRLLAKRENIKKEIAVKKAAIGLTDDD
ncbi:TAFII55 protein conserved region-domain-containing protein [Durotheca rogersii]|uniref:TAFII55 protein conserved region-domain-containing protein n=1 Tax=Durotheca rogersii TaxID=419775 RepID=UPI0022207A6D|nr:TAFII55 protein conserved region-domain-containing protein [Durotheca rogersii]KAI5861870.1 TAFII55 protein conserved region-domain-containing protein [Durotheca rogersii]